MNVLLVVDRGDGPGRCCGAATAALVAYVPNRAGFVIAAAAAITIFGHFLLTAAQGALDAAGDTGY